MPVTLRDLLGRVTPYRPDLKDEQVFQILRESMRRVCKNAQILRTTLVTTGAKQPVQIDGALLRVERIMMYAPEGEFYFLKAATPATIALEAVAASNTPGSFYVATAAGDATGDNIDITGVTAGDIIWSSGGVWNLISGTKLTTIYQRNEPTDALTLRDPNGPTGVPYTWTQANGAIRFYPNPEYDYPTSYEVSYVPNLLTEGDDLELPVEAEDAIVEGAIAGALMMPGEGKDVNHSMVHDRKASIEIAKLKAIAALGYGGSAYYQTGFFGPQYKISNGSI